MDVAGLKTASVSKVLGVKIYAIPPDSFGVLRLDLTASFVISGFDMTGGDKGLKKGQPHTEK